MTDLEIEKYLDENNWTIPAQDGISKILNTSPQIIDTEYDIDNRIMTIITPENVFSFKWVLNTIK